MKKLFLTGGTGLLGQKVLEKLAAKAYDVTLGVRNKEPLKGYRYRFFDLDRTDTAPNFEGIDTVVHLASNTKELNAASDIHGINQILDSMKKYGVGQLIFISIVGVGKVPVKYFKTKKKVEELIQNSGVNYTIVRSTQFHEFFEEEVKKRLKSKLVLIPNLKYQPISTDVVANKIVKELARESTNTIEEIGGPEIIYFKDGIKMYQKMLGGNQIIWHIPNGLLGKLGEALTTQKRIENGIKWGTYLENKMMQNEG